MQNYDTTMNFIHEINNLVNDILGKCEKAIYKSALKIISEFKYAKFINPY